MITKKKIFLIVAIGFLFSPATMHAVPSPHLIVVNESTKECARFFPGDECTYSVLPSGWERKADIAFEICGLGASEAECSVKIKKYCSDISFKYIGFLSTKSIDADCPFRGLNKENNVPLYENNVVLITAFLVGMGIVGFVFLTRRSKREDVRESHEDSK